MVRATILALALLSAAPAYADVPPPPTRPVHWHEQPEPMPEPPPEKAPLLLAFAALAGLVGAAALRTRRPRAARGRLMLRRGDRLAGRFEALGDEADVVYQRVTSDRRGDLGSGSEDRLWLPALDHSTGARVLISPRPTRDRWCDALDTEALARAVQALGSPWIVPVLHAGPGVVFAAPPPVSVRPRLTPRAAATCASQACEVLARVHALGHRPDFGPHSLRMLEEGGAWRIAWLVPSPAEIVARDAPTASGPDPTGASPPETIAGDVARLAGFFLALLGDPAAADPGVVQVHAGLRTCTSAAALARMLAPLADPEAARRVDDLPVFERLTTPPRDWDTIIADGESGELDRYKSLHLATAYHQRASLRFTRGDLEGAWKDGERALALDASVAHRTTRAVLLDRFGRTAEARAEIAATLEFAASLPALAHTFAWEGDSVTVTPAEHARAHTTAGLFALRDGDLESAEHALRSALALHPTATAASALGAALYHRGDLAAAAAAEALAMQLDPGDARHRWALVVSLRDLGRVAEARDLARATVERSPDDPDQRARYDRLFGG